MSVLYGVGVGPGDPELLTVAARRVLGLAGVVVALSQEGRPSRALEIVREALPETARVHRAAIPMQRRERAEAAYAALAETIAGWLAQGRTVAVLCEGDPLFYGSFIYLQRRLQGRFPVRVIPGINSVAAAAAALAQPLARGSETLAVLPASAGEERLRAALAQFDTVAILKAGRRRHALARLIADCGRADEACYCEELGGGEERLLRDLERLPPGPGSYFALFLVTRRAP